jgi:hypothetical protein
MVSTGGFDPPSLGSNPSRAYIEFHNVTLPKTIMKGTVMKLMCACNNHPCEGICRRVHQKDGNSNNFVHCPAAFVPSKNKSTEVNDEEFEMLTKPKRKRNVRKTHQSEF